MPIIIQTPHPALVSPYTHAERAAFARFGREQPWPADRRALLGALQALVDARIVCLADAFARIVLERDACIVTVGTRGKPGWTNQNHFPAAAFDYLEAMSGSGGVLVEFVDPFERRSPPPAPEKEKEITWADIWRPDVGERVLAMTARPRERLILLLAIHLHMNPAEINKLNLSQVRQKRGRDYL